MNALLGAVSGSIVDVTQSVPSPKPGFDATQPVGRFGAITPSKFSEMHGVDEAVADGVAVAVTVGVDVGLGVTVPLEVAVGVAVGVPVQTSGEGTSIPTVIGVPVLKKPIVASAVTGGRLARKRKL